MITKTALSENQAPVRSNHQKYMTVHEKLFQNTNDYSVSILLFRLFLFFNYECLYNLCTHVLMSYSLMTMSLIYWIMIGDTDC